MGVTFEIDHIHPFAAGGKTTFDNLCLSCPTCNRHKGSRLLSGRSEAQLYHPRRDNWEEHFEWSNDGGMLIPKTGVGVHTIEALRINRPEMVLLRRYWKETATFRR
ncbi:MAG: HNH endonuclease [Polyangiaceae bacterium]|nr:HNH endonuclease [Polyangiaceae bacterium]